MRTLSPLPWLHRPIPFAPSGGWGGKRWWEVPAGPRPAAERHWRGGVRSKGGIVGPRGGSGETLAALGEVATKERGTGEESARDRGRPGEGQSCSHALDAAGPEEG